MRVRELVAVILLLLGDIGAALAGDELVTSARTTGGESIPYILTSQPGTPAFAVVLMPGGKGLVNPRMMDGKLVFWGFGNFLIRSRGLFADGRFIAVSTDATSNPERMLATMGDIQARFGKIPIYLIGTSRSTDATMALAKPLDGMAAGFVHSSSMNAISSFDPRGLKSRHLVVLHVKDACRATNPSFGMASHRKYGTQLIQMDGGTSVGDDCEAQAYHGYNGIEAETVARIKGWISQP